MTGFVYLIESSGGMFKVGFTKNDPRRRVAMLRTGSHEELALLGTVPGTMADEKALHELLAPWRVTREWYLPCRAIEYLAAHVTPPKEGNDHPIARARRICGLTQAELGALVGLNRVSIARIETNISSPPLRTIGRIMEALQLKGVDLRVEDFIKRVAA